MQDEGLLQRLGLAAQRLFPRHGILAAYAFGSRISGRARPGSDLDAGYYLAGDRTLSVEEEQALALAIEDAVGVPVDLRDLSHAPLDLRGRVLEDGVRIYSGDPARRVALERDLLARYHDYKHEYQVMHEIRLQRVAAKGL